MKKKLIIINFRKVEILKNFQNYSFCFKHLEFTLVTIWSLNNINENGYITLYIGLTIEPGLRDLVILLCHYAGILLFLKLLLWIRFFIF